MSEKKSWLDQKINTLKNLWDKVTHFGESKFDRITRHNEEYNKKHGTHPTPPTNSPSH